MKRIRSAWSDEEFSMDDGFYSEKKRKDLLDDDEISLIEDAFMRGWEEAA